MVFDRSWTTLSRQSQYVLSNLLLDESVYELIDKFVENLHQVLNRINN
jgi:hypothetical protein